MEKSQHISEISIAKNAAKFSRTQNAYLLCHIKLQIIYAFKKT